jgi:hypothetical protein
MRRCENSKISRRLGNPPAPKFQRTPTPGVPVARRQRTHADTLPRQREGMRSEDGPRRTRHWHRQIDGVPMGSAAFEAACHEEALEATAAVIAGIGKALISHGTRHRAGTSTSTSTSTHPEASRLRDAQGVRVHMPAIEAPNRAGIGWRKVSDAMHGLLHWPLATDLYYTASSSSTGKAGLSRRHDGLAPRQGIPRPRARPSVQASWCCSHSTGNTPQP